MPTPPHCNAEREPRAAAHHVDRLLRLHGGDWNEPQIEVKRHCYARR